jgi:carbonic anhydrase
MWRQPRGSATPGIDSDNRPGKLGALGGTAVHRDHDCCAFDRRTFVSGVLTMGGLAFLPAAAAGRTLGKAARDAMTPDQVIVEMLAGNARFRADMRREPDVVADIRGSAEGQYPAAMVVSCIDSRAVVEVICDLGIGDTFNARVAGNCVNDDILGSAEYACAVAGAKAVVVMGHTGCGAIKGAIDDVVLGNLTLLLARFKSAIDATEFAGDRTSRNKAFVDAVARTNVVLTVKAVRDRSPVLDKLARDGKIKVVGAMYDVATGMLTLV